MPPCIHLFLKSLVSVAGKSLPIIGEMEIEAGVSVVTLDVRLEANLRKTFDDLLKDWVHIGETFVAVSRRGMIDAIHNNPLESKQFQGIPLELLGGFESAGLCIICCYYSCFQSILS